MSIKIDLLDANRSNSYQYQRHDLGFITVHRDIHLFAGTILKTDILQKFSLEFIGSSYI